MGPPSIDTDQDGLSDAEERALGTHPERPDSDGDGLLDGWEVNGREIAGELEPLAEWGCDPLVKDVLVEIDWLEGPDSDPDELAREAHLAALDIARFFARAQRGIRIHIDLGDAPERFLEEGDVRARGFDRFRSTTDPAKRVPRQAVLPLHPACSGAGSPRSLYDLYHDTRYFRVSRRNVFYWVLICEEGLASDLARHDATGIVSSFLDDRSRRAGLRPTGVHVSAVFFGPLRRLPAERRRFHLASSILHELGHGFGLGHGGTLPDGRWSDLNHKPNYPSVMNHRFQLWGVDRIDGSPALGFSTGRHDPLDEREVFEPVGMGPLPNEHVRSILDVQHIDDTRLPNNLDWNRNAAVDRVPFGADLNADGRIGPELLEDHDDWGRLLRDGFDGIGVHAHRSGGLGCCVAGHVDRRLVGDLDHDGSVDLLVLRGADATLFPSTESGGLDPRRASRLGSSVDTWELRHDDRTIIFDLEGTRGHGLLLHRGAELAVVTFEGARPNVSWRGDTAPPARPDGEPWRFAAEDHVRSERIGSRGSPTVVVTRGGRAAVLRWSGDGIVAVGEPPIPADDLEPLAVQGGRSLPGAGSLLVRGPGSLLELTWTDGAMTRRRLDEDGRIAPAADDVSGWSLSSGDCFVPLDLDGDGTDELLTKSGDAIGTLAEVDGGLRTLWVTRRRVEGWPIGDSDEVRCGDWLPSPGDEVVLFNGQSLVALDWSSSRSALALHAVANGFVPAADPGEAPWTLDAGQRLVTGRFAPDGERVLAIVGEDGLAVVRVDDEGFRATTIHRGSIAGWPASAAHQVQVVGLPGGARDGLFFENVDRIGLVDIEGAGRLLFAARLEHDPVSLSPLVLFQRGDTNRDGLIDLSDAVAVLFHLFLGAGDLSCPAAADADDNGRLDVSDGIRVLDWLFAGGPPPLPPGPFEPGIDPTPDLACEPAAR